MMPDDQKPKQHLSRDELIREFQVNPVAFLRQLSNASVPVGQPPAANTHLLMWSHGKPHDRGLFTQEVIDFLLEYILKLEAQLVIEVNEFRTKSIKELVTKPELSGFNKVQ
jgi:hypothetical protein